MSDNKNIKGKLKWNHIIICIVILLSILGLQILTYYQNHKTYENHETLFNYLTQHGFKTNRLIASETTSDDINILSVYLLDKKVTEKLDATLDKGFSNKEEAAAFLSELKKQNDMSFTLHKKDNTPIGQISYTYYNEMLLLSYWVASDYQNQGYASEITVPLTEKIFKGCDDIKTLYIACDYKNNPAQSLAEKICNFINKSDKYEYTTNENETSDEYEGKTIDFHYKEYILTKKVS